MYLGHLRLDRL